MNNIRIRTQPNGSDQYLQVKIEQDFDFIEVLSLNISQENAYRNFCADYGVVVGRVIINSGFGVPNAKVSIFIPLDTIDAADPNISGLYPYTTVNDKNSHGIRYNLLPSSSDSQDACYTPIGSFPTKREILDNDEMLYVYKKYYQFTTTTNYAGDFMIFGVPLGNHTVHVDMDISNIGIASQRPYDLISQGAPQSLFFSPTKFKSSTNINSLPQIKTANASVNVRPFWGDVDNCQIGINRLDFDMNYNITPHAIFMGGVFGDKGKHSVNKNCIPRKKVGKLADQETNTGTIQMIRKTADNTIESFDVDGGQLIDNNGAWAYQIPMNLDYVITDEFGRLVPSSDPNIGIPTRSRVRFKISMDEGGGLGRLRTRAKYLVPHNPTNGNDIDYSFDDTTKDVNFTDIYWDKIYTVKNYIKRYPDSPNRLHYVGVKDTDKESANEHFPYNKSYTQSIDFNLLLFTIICLLTKFITYLAAAINTLLIPINLIIQVIEFVNYPCIHLPIIGDICLWGPLIPGLNNLSINIVLDCNTDDNFTSFAPNVTDFLNGSENDWSNCIAISMANNLDIYQLDFYDEWINGSLYYYLLKYKNKHNNTAKYCHNLITNNNNELFYIPFDGNNKLYATDLINLGAVLECDWQGYPKLFDYLSPTTYKVPPLIYEQDPLTNEIETGMFSYPKSNSNNGLFFKVDCSGVSVIGDSNISKLCEIGVELPESTGSTITQITINQIYNTSDSIDVANSYQKFIRDSFTLANIYGSNTPQYPLNLIPNLVNFQQGTSFYTLGYINSQNGSLYNQFRTNNSYYMYFGLLAGKTGYDKAKNKFFTPCVATINDNFTLEINIIPPTTTSSTDGIIDFTIIGGIIPFTYTVVGDNYSLGPVSGTTSPFIVNNISNGTYTLTVTDGINTTVVREINV